MTGVTGDGDNVIFFALRGTRIMPSESLPGYAFVMLRRVRFMSLAAAIARSMVIKVRAVS